MQIATRNHVYLIDTLSVGDMTPIGEFLEDDNVVKIIHAADYDVWCLDRQWGFRIRNLFDTAVAARFTGLRSFGLSAVAKTLLGEELPKTTRLQRGDWSRRPLDPDALEYAANDVRYLHAIYLDLTMKLHDLGRDSWVMEECRRLEDIRFTRADPETEYLSTKGISKLDGRARAILRRLHSLRDTEARRRDRPPYFVISNESMVQLASKPNTDLSTISQLRNQANGRMGRLVRAALRRGLNDQPVPELRPEPRIQITPVERLRLDRLKKWRTNKGTFLDIDPSLVWPMKSLERLARSPESADDRSEHPEVRNWQQREFREELEVCLSR